MANHKSAEKRNRQNLKRRTANRQNLHRLRSQLKNMTSAIGSNNVDSVKSLLSPTLSLIDKSVKKGVLHKGAAARRKSRLMRKVNTILASQVAS
jgi:small subunit ribosomal protein S20